MTASGEEKVRGQSKGQQDLEAPERVDAYFSGDVETDGPIPGPFSMLSFGLVFAGTFDGKTFRRPTERKTFYRELRPISDSFSLEALRISGLDRDRLLQEGSDPAEAMKEAAEWLAEVAGKGEPVLVAFPLGFDWSWLYWYFMNFLGSSPFSHSRGFDIKTAYGVKARKPIAAAGRARLLKSLRPELPHTHHALDDALEQAEIFARVIEWDGQL